MLRGGGVFVSVYIVVVTLPPLVASLKYLLEHDRDPSSNDASTRDSLVRSCAMP